MSYEIEYAKHAYKTKDKYNNDVFFSYIEIASNNVHPRIPRPVFFAEGESWKIIQRACQIGMDCESGCFKPRGRWVSPESYIRRWREVLKEAPSFEWFIQRNPHTKFEIAVKKEKFLAYLTNSPTDDEYSPANQIRGIIKDIIPRERRFYDEDVLIYEVPIKTFDDVHKATSLKTYLTKDKQLYWFDLIVN